MQAKKEREEEMEPRPSSPIPTNHQFSEEQLRVKLARREEAKRDYNEYLDRKEAEAGRRSAAVSPRQYLVADIVRGNIESICLH